MVNVLWHLINRSTKATPLSAFKYEKARGGSSLGCSSRDDQSMVRPSNRGGVPVLSRPNGSLSFVSKVSLSPMEGASSSWLLRRCRPAA